jgi:hypothetical protein
MNAGGARTPSDKEEREKIFFLWGSAQLLEKAGFGQANPRKSKRFPLICFAGFGWAWPDLGKFGLGFGKSAA